MDYSNLSLDELADLTHELPKGSFKYNMVRTVLVEKAEPYLQKIVSRIKVPQGVEYGYDDILQEARFMLIKALNNYDLENDSKFTTYMYIRVRGRIIQYFRKHDPLSRGQRKKAGELRQLKHEFEQKFGRFPNVDELATMYGESKSTVRTVLGFEVLRNSESLDSDESTHHPMSDDLLQAKYDKKYLLQKLKKLPVRERVIILMYYFFDMTGREIGKFFSITQTYVYQLKSNGLKKIRS